MQQILIPRAVLIILSLISSLAFGLTDNHLEKLRSRFPFGLLGDDHGVLILNDLAKNACTVRPRPFKSTSRYYPYEYWQCFESKTIFFDCDSNGTSDEYEGVMGLIVVKAAIGQEKHEYIQSRLWPIKECKRFIKDAAALLKGTQYACISGSYIETEKDRFGHPSGSWVFGRIKTKKGCEGRDCEFTKKFKKDNCPDLKL